MESLTESSIIAKLDNQIEFTQPELKFLISEKFRVDESYGGGDGNGRAEFFKTVCKVGGRFFEIFWVRKLYPVSNVIYYQPCEVEPVEKTVKEYVPLQVD